MEASGAGIGRLDCYEDMFKEITRKLYGDDPDHRSKPFMTIHSRCETPTLYQEIYYSLSFSTLIYLIIFFYVPMNSLQCTKRIRDICDVQNWRRYRSRNRRERRWQLDLRRWTPKRYRWQSNSCVSCWKNYLAMLRVRWVIQTIFIIASQLFRVEQSNSSTKYILEICTEF